MGRLLGYLVCRIVWGLCLCVKSLLPLQISLRLSWVPGTKNRWWDSPYLEGDSRCGLGWFFVSSGLSLITSDEDDNT